MTLAGFRNSVVSSTTGLPVSGATVTVTLAGTSTPASIYRDKNAVTPITELATDAAGFFEFYAAAGTYDVTVSLGANSVVWNDVAVGTMQSTDYTRVWRVGSGEAEDLDVAISNALPVVKSAAEWAADTTTVLILGRIGLESDTGKFKFGDGSSLFSEIENYAAGESDVTAATLARDVIDVTGDLVLSAANASSSISESAFTLDRLLRVNGASGTVTMTPASDVLPGMMWAMQVIDASNAVRVEPGEWVETRVGTLASGDATVSSIDTTNLEAGFELSGNGVATGAVIDSVTDGSNLEMDLQATDTLPAEPITIDAGVQGKVNNREAGVALAAGMVFVTALRRDFGIELDVRGSTVEFKTPVPTFPLAASSNLTDAMIGARIRASHASTPIVLTIEDDATILANSERLTTMTGAWFSLRWVGAAAVSIDDSSGVTVLDAEGEAISAARALIGKGAEIVGMWVSEDTWEIAGGLEAAP